MTYSCGIFKDENTTLEEASIEKLDQICKKLNLKSTDSILEIGTGWGSFAIHAAKNYGCSVTTTTISDAQYKFAKQRIKDEKLSNKINLLNKDYRYLEGKFDKIASIEMIEAVGHKNVPEYFKKVSSLLNEDGTFVMQGITYNDQNFEVYKNSVDFINKYIFPGSCLISINQVSEIIKINTDMIFKDLEDITEHYATTLKIWRTNFFDKISEIRDLGFSQEFINLWEFYFVYCEAGFIEKNIGDYQFVFSKKQGLK
jgi:cyclopropane-fatty-acyl-phospholipid synthase